jgi:hypothetical protein
MSYQTSTKTCNMTSYSTINVPGTSFLRFTSSVVLDTNYSEDQQYLITIHECQTKTNINKGLIIMN